MKKVELYIVVSYKMKKSLKYQKLAILWLFFYLKTVLYKLTLWSYCEIIVYIIVLIYKLIFINKMEKVDFFITIKHID